MSNWKIHCFNAGIKHLSHPGSHNSHSLLIVRVFDSIYVHLPYKFWTKSSLYQSDWTIKSVNYVLLAFNPNSITIVIKSMYVDLIKWAVIFFLIFNKLAQKIIYINNKSTMYIYPIKANVSVNDNM